MPGKKESFEVSFRTFEENFRMDELDRFWKIYPSLVARIKERMIEVAKKKRKAAQVFKMEEARLYQEIAENPQDYKLSKTTETAIRNAILMDPGYIEARDASDRADDEFEELAQLLRTASEYSISARELGSLYLGQYYTETREGAKPTAQEELEAKMRARASHKPKMKDK